MHRPLLVLLLIGAFPRLHSAQEYNVSTPPTWFSGDTHEHFQLCADPPELTYDPDDQDLADYLEEKMTAIRTEMDLKNLNVANVLAWNMPLEESGPGIWPAVFGLISGSDLVLPFSDPASNRLLVMALETSGLDCSAFGHLIGLRLSLNAYLQADFFGPQPIPGAGDLEDCWVTPCQGNGDDENDGSGDLTLTALLHLAPVNPDAVFGYSHQVWPRAIVDDASPYDYTLFDDPPTTDAVCITEATMGTTKMAFANHGHGRHNRVPPLLPVDVTFRRVQFIEATVFPKDNTDPELTRYAYYGAYYKLLNAGQRPALSGGTDADCLPNSQARTYVRLPDTNLTYDAWVDGLAAGRTSIARGPSLFLNLELGSAYEYTVGDQIDLSSGPSGSATIPVRVTLEVADDANVPQYDPCAIDGTGSCLQDDRLEIIVNGEALPQTIQIPPFSTGLTVEFELPVALTESSWIAARQASGDTHTAAAYVLLDHQPIAQCVDAEYWAIWTDHLRNKLNAPPPAPAAVLGSRECCNTASDVDMDLQEARKVFAAIRDFAYQNVVGKAVRLGQSTYGPLGPIPIGIRSYNSVHRSLFTFNAPANRIDGKLLVGKTLLVPPVLQDGALIYVGDLISEPTFSTNEAGFHEKTYGVPTSGYGKTLYYQFVWDYLGAAGDAVASDVLKIPGNLQQP